ncbi:hypothetical protein [Glutamicibacter creatinolyticus]|uniref:hypothetical protein n=1 Tax=Glutamicibacter creatinolyticus TaxID=162496 RepID=UPI00337A5C20
MDQFLVPVRGGCRGSDVLVGDAPEHAEERLVGFRSEAAQDARLVQGNRRESVHVKLSVAHTLVVGDVDARPPHILDRSDELHVDAELPAITDELTPDPEGRDDQARTARVCEGQAQGLQLHDALAQPESCEDGPPATLDRPTHDVPLVILEERIHVPGSDGLPVGLFKVGFRLDEVKVAHDAIFSIAAKQAFDFAPSIGHP